MSLLAMNRCRLSSRAGDPAAASERKKFIGSALYFTTPAQATLPAAPPLPLPSPRDQAVIPNSGLVSTKTSPMIP